MEKISYEYRIVESVDYKILPILVNISKFDRNMVSGSNGLIL